MSIEAYSFQIILALVRLNLGNGVRHKMQITEIIIPPFLLIIVVVILLLFFVLEMKGLEKSLIIPIDPMPTLQSDVMCFCSLSHSQKYYNLYVLSALIQHSDSSHNMQEKSCHRSMTSLVVCKLCAKYYGNVFDTATHFRI